MFAEDGARHDHFVIRDEMSIGYCLSTADEQLQRTGGLVNFKSEIRGLGLSGSPFREGFLMGGVDFCSRRYGQFQGQRGFLVHTGIFTNLPLGIGRDGHSAAHFQISGRGDLGDEKTIAVRVGVGFFWVRIIELKSWL